MKKKTKEKIPVVIYARYSSKMQSDFSIAAQLRICRKYAADNGYDIVNEYIDRERTAREMDNRDSFQQLIKDSEYRTFKYVLVYCQNRFAREVLDSKIVKKQLWQNGVKVISVTEFFPDTPIGHFCETITEGYSQFQSEELGQNILRGFVERAHNGIHTGGIPPLGYDVDVITKKLIINEKEAKAVKLIYEMFINHHSLNEICNELNKLGYKTKTGNEFKCNSLHSIIRNKKYCGYYVYNRRVAECYGKGNSHKEKDKEEIVEEKGVIPAIISEKTFNMAVELLDNRKGKSGKYSAKNVYMLTGKVVCGHCGCNMTGNASTNSKKITTLTYTCEKRKTKNGCPNMNIRKDKLDELVAEELRKYIFSSENLPNLYKKIVELNNSRDGENKCTIKRIQKRLKDNERDKAKIIQAIKQGLDPEDFKEELDRLREEKKAYEETIEEIKTKNNNSAITEERLQKLNDIFVEYITNNRNAEISKLIDTFVDNVTEDNNKVIIKLRIR